jgi:hypothetical protein
MGDMSYANGSNDRKVLKKSFDKLRMNGERLIPFVVSHELVEGSNHEWNQFV